MNGHGQVPEGEDPKNWEYFGEGLPNRTFTQAELAKLLEGDHEEAVKVRPARFRISPSWF